MRVTTKYVDLLYFLVVLQLVTQRKTHEWLSSFQLVESLQGWLVIHRAKCDWRDRVWIGHASLQIARRPARSTTLNRRGRARPGMRWQTGRVCE